MSRRNRCKIDGAVARLGVEARTVRDMAAAGQIPGAAKLRGSWTFDVALLDAFISEKERETCLNSQRPRRAVTGVMAPSGGGYKPGAQTSGGHYAQTIQKLRQSVVKRSETA